MPVSLSIRRQQWGQFERMLSAPHIMFRPGWSRTASSSGHSRCSVVRVHSCTGRIVFSGGILHFPCTTLVCMRAVVLIEAGLSTPATLLNILNHFFLAPPQDLFLESRAACQEAASQRWRCLRESVFINDHNTFSGNKLELVSRLYSIDRRCLQPSAHSSLALLLC